MARYDGEATHKLDACGRFALDIGVVSRGRLLALWAELEHSQQALSLCLAALRGCKSRLVDRAVPTFSTRRLSRRLALSGGRLATISSHSLADVRSARNGLSGEAI